MNHIDTAVILAAGQGTRRMPITRVVDKVMLPIGNRPTVDYIVEQCAQADIERVVFVISPNQTLLRKYYGNRLDIAQEYPWLGKNTSLHIEYAVQDPAEYGYGTAAAVMSARKQLGGNVQFLAIAGDAFFYSPEINPLSLLLQAQQDGVEAALLGLEVPMAETKQFGIVTADNQDQLVGLVEKPASLPNGTLPLANISYYALSSSIFPAIEAIERTNGEFYITDALLEVATQAQVRVVPTQGQYLDSGQLEKWVAANQLILQNGK